MAVSSFLLPLAIRAAIVPLTGGKTGKEKTQKEVADMIGISQSYISRLEKKIISKLKRELEKTAMWV